MSRSYKKNPYFTDGSPGIIKKVKRLANKKVRRIKSDILLKGGLYKKVFESWNIHDYKDRWTWEEAKADWENDKNEYLKKSYPTLKSYYRYWLKCCKLK